MFAAVRDTVAAKHTLPMALGHVCTAQLKVLRQWKEEAQTSAVIRIDHSHYSTTANLPAPLMDGKRAGARPAANNTPAGHNVPHKAIWPD